MDHIYIVSIQRSREDFVFLLYRTNLSGFPFAEIPAEEFILDLQEDKKTEKTNVAIADYIKTLIFELHKFEEIAKGLERLSGRPVPSLRGLASGYQREWDETEDKAQDLADALDKKSPYSIDDIQVHVVSNSLSLNEYLQSALVSIEKKIPLDFYLESQITQENEWFEEIVDAEVNKEIDLSHTLADSLTNDKEKKSLTWQAHIAAYKTFREEIFITESNFEVLDLNVQSSGLLQ